MKREKANTDIILTNDRRVQAIANRRKEVAKIKEGAATRARMREFGSQSAPLLYSVLSDGAWKNQTCFIIAGGPSLQNFKPMRLKGAGRIIAVNRAYEKFPFADVMFSMDSRYYQWIKGGRLGKTALDKFLKFKGLKVWMDTFGYPYKEDVHIVQGLGKNGMSKSITEGLTHGNNSGYAALQLAVALRANPIYLLGFDMSHRKSTTGVMRTHWHSGYPIIQEEKTIQSFIRPFYEVADDIQRLGIKVFNCYIDSQLKCFKYCNVYDIIGKAR